VKITDLAKLTGKSVEELEAEFAKEECIVLDLNERKR